MTQQFLSTAGVAGQQIEAVGPEGPVRMVLGAIGTSNVFAYTARNIVETNVASLAAFDVTTLHDGVSNVEGDIVCLAAQTSLPENGPYIVGAVTAGSAPLTRPTWWATGTTLPSGIEIKVGGEGTVFGNSQWVVMAQQTVVVDTDDPALYPRSLGNRLSLVNGLKAVSVPILTTSTSIMLTRRVPSTTDDTVEYQVPDESIVVGPIGTGQFSMQACLADGTTNAADNSELFYLILNQGVGGP
jgi:hypothetical protein